MEYSKPTKKEIEKFANYCAFLFGRKPFVDKEDDIYIYGRFSYYGWNYFDFVETHKGYFSVYTKGFVGNPILITDLMPGYKKYLLLG